MKSVSSCIPCFLEQAHSSVNYAIDDDVERSKILQEVSCLIKDLDLDRTPAYNSSLVLHKTNELLGADDPYAAAKKESNQKAMALLPTLHRHIRDSEDKLETAVRLAVVGNVIDLGIKHEADLEQTMEDALGSGFARFDIEAFKEKLAGSQRILYLLDNAGEIVFDRVLIEGLRANGKMVAASVKSKPILNDAVMEDAATVGLDKLVKVIDTGSNFVGVNREAASDFFLKVLDSADMVIAKGQGNYETLAAEGGRFFFILKAKCAHVADSLGVDEDDLVLARG